MSDMISPVQCRDFSLAFVRPLAEAIRAAGMLSVHYYCGRPHDRWEMLLDTGADALALEEGKKGFDIDIMQAAGIVQGRMALLGNIDAIAMMEHGSDAALQAEIARQCEAGRVNRNRFVVSLGSPVTPGTPLQRVRRYCDLVHKLA
jgi:uroporphyrinogen-III decarboxylase